MAVDVLLEGNILKVNYGGAKVEYWNAAWVSVHFVGTTVVLTNNLLQDNSGVNNPYVIEKADFEYNSVSITSETAIVTALSAVIG